MRNILITYLSTLRENNPIKYTYETTKGNKIGFEAPYTSEAAVRYLGGYFKEKNQTLDVIIALCSGAVRTQNDNAFGKTAADYFGESVKEVFADCEIRMIELDRIEDVGKVFVAADDISNESRLFVDITGGFRDAVYTLSLVTRFLEFRNAVIEKVIYSQITTDKNKKVSGKIVNYTDSYRLIDLVNGMNEFVNFGNVTTLERFFAKSKNESIHSLVKSMYTFSESISLGKTNDLEKITQELRSNIEAVENCHDENIECLILKDMLPVIREKIFDREEIISILEWCTENRMIQQALTLYTEKIPKYLFDKKLLTADKERAEKAQSSKQDYEDVYANMLYSDLVTSDNSRDKLKSVVESINAARPIMRSGIIKGIKKNDPIRKAVDGYMEILGITEGKNLRSFRNKKFKFSETNINEAWKVLMSENTIIDIKKETNGKFFDALLGVSAHGKNDTSANAVLEKKIGFVKQLASGKDPAGYQFSVSSQAMSKVIAGYIYIKQVRNEIIHASDSENLTREQADFFKQYGYNYEKTLDSLAEDIRTGIKSIRDAERERKI